MPTRPKTGETRKTRQPLKIDKLPVELRERIQSERAKGSTWIEIEELSPDFEEWEKVPGDVQQHFPGRKLPRSSLQRWYDIRVEQIQREIVAEAEKARQFAAVFAGRGFKELPDAVRNALGDQIFSLMQSADAKDKQQFRKELMGLGILLAEHRKLDIREQKQKTDERVLEMKIQQMKRQFDKEANEAAKKLGKGKQITEDDINRIRERTFGLPPVQRGAAASHPA
jgi:hypothetical protein